MRVVYPPTVKSLEEALRYLNIPDSSFGTPLRFIGRFEVASSFLSPASLFPINFGDRKYFFPLLTLDGELEIEKDNDDYEVSVNYFIDEKAGRFVFSAGGLWVLRQHTQSEIVVYPFLPDKPYITNDLNFFNLVYQGKSCPLEARLFFNFSGIIKEK